ncbi:MAG TPA: type III-A CRISPR-associated protein Csm2 [Melioribacteraceae bacterium]|nr:type III-A CRISPR-associated protein Csm2 [Melioribacteraceae bacterium]
MPVTYNNIDGSSKIKSWVTKGIDPELILWSEGFAMDLVRCGLKTNQIRNVFGEVKRIQLTANDFLTNEGKIQNKFDEKSILLLIPKLAYVAKKSKVTIANDLKAVLTSGLNAVITGNNTETKKAYFENFVNVLESILAYHKAHGGE